MRHFDPPVIIVVLLIAFISIALVACGVAYRGSQNIDVQIAPVAQLITVGDHDYVITRGGKAIVHHAGCTADH